jgi:hypothetical protein
MLILLVAIIFSSAFADPFGTERVSFIVRRKPTTQSLSTTLYHWRGGAEVPAVNEWEDESEDFDDEEEEEDDEEEEEVDTVATGDVSNKNKQAKDSKLDPALTAAALKSAEKVQKKITAEKTTSAKSKVNEKLSASTATSPKQKKKSSSSSLGKLLRVPYIVRAILNPVTLFGMTKAYWASLFNLDYGKQAPQATELRSALEEKAKRSPSSSSGKKKKTMKRGQSKSLSDLPQLSS